MKKKLLFSTVIAIFALGVIGTISVSKTSANNLLFANVEALASGEGGNGMTNLGGTCSKCGAQNVGCLWCVESPNSCNCTSSHTCN